jgi:hypothetical protein
MVGAADEPRADSRSLAAALEPLLIETAGGGGRLGHITWFKTDWQRGGAATGFAEFRDDDGRAVSALVKLPVVRREFLWTQRLQAADSVGASGTVAGSAAETNGHGTPHPSNSSSMPSSEHAPAGDHSSPDCGRVVPRLLACGEAIGGYDLAWIIIEKFDHGPLGLHWHQDHLMRIADAAARFYAATSSYEVDQCAKR